MPSHAWKRSRIFSSIAGVVWPTSARFTLADRCIGDAHTGSVPRAGERGDAAADTGRHRNPLLQPVSRAIPDGSRLGPGGRTGCAAPLAGARVLLPSPQP